MADPLRLLAPPVGPQAPALEAGAREAGALPWLIGLALLTGLALAWAVRRWWRGRWQRDLRRLRRTARRDGPRHAADGLASAARARRVAAPPSWWVALDAVRFAQPAPTHEAIVVRLLDEARHLVPRDRLLRPDRSRRAV